MAPHASISRLRFRADAAFLHDFGNWQTLGFHSDFLTRLSTIHTSRALKDGSGLSSGLLRIFVLLMAISFVATILLGVLITLRTSKNRKPAFWCLAAGVIIPLAVIVIQTAK